MIAWLDSQLPPLDPALGFILLLAALAGFCLARLLDRPARGTVPDPHAHEYGDVTERPHG
ncbi:hypothetical protein ACFPOB_26030 [Bosea eneae]|uniref:Uncharacterized protein n=1 Tax=Bosea eneae TaxID=151454 RepID=A0ABW0IY56_9HYPH